MSNIRIKDLTTTAATTASDDFVAVDGTTNGTRKLNAYSPTFGGNLTVSGTSGITATDLILGTSGPSTKSSIAARAARQGLVFDGTASATIASVPAFGTLDFTFAAIVNPSATASANQTVIAGSNGALYLAIKTDGTIAVAVNGAGFTGNSTGTVQFGKNSLIAYTRSGTTGTFYINGVASGTITDSGNYSVAVTSLNYGAGVPLIGTIDSPLVYNRALSAAEVVALYEAGVPAGADYATPAATNTSLNTSAFTNTGYGFNAYPTFSGASATGFTAAAVSAATYAAGTGSTFNTTNGKNLLVSFTLTLTSGQAPTLTVAKAFNPDASANYTATAGTNSILIPMTRTDTGYTIRFLNTAATSYAVSNFSVVPAGLLLAPDAGQAGGGLTWYDTSGNAANITLPASGVSWNVLSSRYLGGNWTTSGNLTVSGTGTSSFESTTPPTVAVQNTTSGLAGTQTGANGVLLGTLKFGHPNDAQSANFPSIVGRFSLTDASFARCTALDFYTSSASGNARVGTFTELGNLLIGTTTDSSNGKLQLTSHTTSAGGIGFGTDWGIYRKSQYTLGLNVASGAKPLFVYTDVTNVGFFDQADVNTTTGWSGYYITPGDKALKLATNNTTALTLDSSQNATFAGQASFSTTTDRGGITLNFPVGPTGSNGPAVTFKTWTNSATLINAGRIASIITDGTASYASKLEFSVATAGSLTTALIIESNSNATVAGKIKTVAPTSGSAKFWALGEAATVSPTSPNRTIRVEIDGTVYYIHAKTTND